MTHCPRCERARLTTDGLATDGLVTGDWGLLCPVCLFATALSIDDRPCPYDVIAPIDQDSQGITYLAQPIAGVPRLVALKVLGPRDDGDAILSRFEEWKPALSRVQHPSAATVLDAGRTEEGSVYVASEYVAGSPLPVVLSRAARATTERAEIARQLTEAIGAAHAAGVVHLHLDTTNVKISTAGGLHATILGFGLSLIVDGATGSPDVDLLALTRLICALGL